MDIATFNKTYIVEKTGGNAAGSRRAALLPHFGGF
jgi:hypothetical protein